MSVFVTRFAPSPTGLLHLGHAHSALFAKHEAGGGRFIVRIEDIDRTRCRPEFVAAIIEDLAWLDLGGETPVRRQSEHMDDYARALNALNAAQLLYPCFCTRRDIETEIANAGVAPHLDPAGSDGPLYPGTCRALTPAKRAAKIAQGIPFALRLDTAAALRRTGTLTWTDRARGEQAARPDLLGDVVLARKDVPTSYHLAVTVDDALQGVNLVTRGEDLFTATHVHRLLQALLGLPTPVYHHHRLLTDESGRRFAKRDAALTLRALREAGKTPQDVKAMAGF